MIKVASFDVFDTCLIRRVIVPSTLFWKMARKLQTEDPSLDREWAQAFVAARIEAERRALTEAAPVEETTLDEIWRRLIAMMQPWGFTAQAGCELEEAEEAASLEGIPAAVESIQRHRRNGVRIAFVSDTYLSTAFVAAQLTRCGLYEAGDVLLVSSEHGSAKRTGSLFKKLVFETGVAPAEIEHSGDNWVADVLRPREQGIHATLVTWTTRNRAEDELLTMRADDDDDVVSTAGALRFQRVTSRPSAQKRSSPEHLVETFLGPVTCLMGHWLLRQAKYDGRTRLYFAARDTRLLWKTTERLAAISGAKISCRYLKVSRQALAVPSITEITPGALPWLFRYFERAQLSRLLAKIELAPSEFLPQWSKKYPRWNDSTDLVEGEAREVFWQCLQHPEILEKIRVHANSRRQSALRYFERSGLFDGTRSAFVDLGWHLTCQAALNGICRTTPGFSQLPGYYLGLKHQRKGPGEDAASRALIYESAPDLPKSAANQWLGGWRETVLEHVFGMADHPSVTGYDDDGEVIYRKKEIAALHRTKFGEVESALADYVECCGSPWAALAEDDSTCRRVVGEWIHRFFLRPSEEALGALRHLEASSDQNNVGATLLVRPNKVKESLNELWPQWLKRTLQIQPVHETVWPEAAEMTTPSTVRLIKRFTRIAHRFYR